MRQASDKGNGFAFTRAGAIRFVDGGGSEVDIDHVVAFSDAWQKGPRDGPPESGWHLPTTR